MSRLLSLLALCAAFSSCVSNTTKSTSSSDSTVTTTTAPKDTEINEPADTAATTTQSAQPTQPQTPEMAYRLVTKKDSIRKVSKYFDNLPVLLAMNRVDSGHIASLDKMLVPEDLSKPLEQYSPFPQSLPFLQGVKKIVYFSYPAQYFAAYENGQLKYTGPTNMGRKKDPTATGLFFTNWKAEKTRSTFNDEWELKWNFNIDNKAGIGWHQYAMPGYPASHSCLRLQTTDAINLYNWAEEWVMKGGKTLAQGTPVIVFGSYPFDSGKPWLQLASNPHALDITPEQLQTETQPYLEKIMAEQQRKGTK